MPTDIELTYFWDQNPLEIINKFPFFTYITFKWILIAVGICNLNLGGQFGTTYLLAKLMV
jgi:hypothetical protein